MGLSDLFRAIFSLFAPGRGGPNNASIPAQTSVQQGIPAGPGGTIQPGKTDIAPAAPEPAPKAPEIPVAPVVPVSVAPPVPAAADVDAWLPLARPLSQHFEQCYLTAYPDPASALGKALQARGLWYKMLAGAPIPNDPVLRALSGAPWTCGWGSTGSDVKQGTQWTQEMADLRHDENLRASGALVDAAARVPLSAQQKAAMVCIVNNVGPGRAARAGEPGRDGIITLASGQPSTLLRHLNIGDYPGAAEQFLAWNRAGGVVLPGLVRRRAAERDLFLTGHWSAS
ncbi:lysozyme [Burkholderia cenocepacia]|uniref:lysozyme n=1 Tax=Burkholderia cenocepacia TaxID=95486 RepID=UPI00201909C4|nr:lysozyme [Burkholderia cenocepacia]MCO1409002.1 lysozyme [Burkholderia cenocepacia]UQN92023.1 lysozyme [Burkholderia cenocepacia]UQN99172.1 lysozyme [Burkholderia cenocepacia]UQP50873.1 lysozyme [Burkholderia cenocepacia]